MDNYYGPGGMGVWEYLGSVPPQTLAFIVAVCVLFAVSSIMEAILDISKYDWRALFAVSSLCSGVAYIITYYSLI